MDRFDPDFICNASDDGGRYTYAKQPEICKWNLGKLAEAIGEAVPVEETKEIVESVFDDAFRRHYRRLMADKLGLKDLIVVDDGEATSSSTKKLDDLIASLLDTMKSTGADFTNTFRVLSDLPFPDAQKAAFAEKKRSTLEKLSSQCCSVDELKKSLGYYWNLERAYENPTVDRT